MEHQVRGQIFYEEEGNVLKKNVELTPLAGVTANGFAYKTLWEGKEGAPSFEEFYDIEGTIQCIKANQFEKVALQFPDEMLGDSSAVAKSLKEGSGAFIFVLGDTSYGSCCVDEVTAEHLQGEVVIHYGRSCLSKTSRLPVYNVFGRSYIDVHDFIDRINNISNNRNIIVFYDLLYQYKIDEIRNMLIHNNNIKFTRVERGLIQPINNNYSIHSNQEEYSHNNSTSILGRKLYDDNDDIMIDWYDVEEQESRDIIYIGNEGVTLNNIIMSMNRSKIYSYEPCLRRIRVEGNNVNKSLMRRYNMVQKIMDSNSIGIVVGTLGVGGYLNVIEYLKKTIREAEKKYYTFIVGKINVAKLANFQEIDIFVLVACPENSLIESREFYKPIVTPYEVQLALQRGKEWSGRYVTEFGRILNDDNTEDNIDDGDDDEDCMRFSTIDGRLKPKIKTKSV